MEHIVQFAIGIDDDAIRRRVEECAYEDIIKSLTKEARGTIAKRYGHPDWEGLVRREMWAYFDEHREEIIGAVAKEIVERARRTKKVQDAKKEAGL